MWFFFGGGVECLFCFKKKITLKSQILILTINPHVVFSPPHGDPGDCFLFLKGYFSHSEILSDFRHLTTNGMLSW